MNKLKLLLCALLLCGCEAVNDQYLGQTPPGNIPEMFMSGVISKRDTIEFGSVFSKDGRSFYFATGPSRRHEIQFSQSINGQWTPFEVLLKHPDYGFNDPFLSNDEQRLYFISRKPKDDRDVPLNHDIWYIQKEADGWSEPINAGPQINSDKNEYYISFSEDGSMYFSSNKDTDSDSNFDIYRAQAIEGGWAEPVKLSDAINTEAYEADAFIAPDESYLIFTSRGRDDGAGGIDLYISFKDDEGNWLPSKNLGRPINSRGPDYCPFVTKDGKYLFYTSYNDIYWVSTKVLDQMR